MKIPTSVFYQPLIPQALFASVIYQHEDTLAAQKAVLSFLDTRVCTLVCTRLPDLPTRQHFIELAFTPGSQDAALLLVQQYIPNGIAFLEERLERALLELYSTASH